MGVDTIYKHKKGNLKIVNEIIEIRTKNEIPINIKGIKTKGIDRYGIKLKYPSKDIASKLKLKVIEIEKPIPAECANGNLINITWRQNYILNVQLIFVQKYRQLLYFPIKRKK